MLNYKNKFLVIAKIKNVYILFKINSKTRKLKAKNKGG